MPRRRIIARQKSPGRLTWVRGREYGKASGARARAPRTSRRAPTRSARIRSPSARRRFAATRVDRPMCVRRSPRARRRKWRARAGMPVARCGKALPFRSREAALSRSRGSQIRGVSARDFRGVEIANRETPRRVETDGADRHLSVTGQRPRLIDPLYAFKQRSPRGFPETRSSGLTPPIEPAIDRSGATVRRSDASRTADFFAPPAIDRESRNRTPGRERRDPGSGRNRPSVRDPVPPRSIGSAGWVKAANDGNEETKGRR